MRVFRTNEQKSEYRIRAAPGISAPAVPSKLPADIPYGRREAEGLRGAYSMAAS
ncbi:hypothetical protein D3C78_989030 [compost metagenome]